jgi:hypothetical protein
MKQSDEMDAARQMINFLLETAEMRIRDTALCGWAHRGLVLERCFAILINGYYTQIVGVLGRFFESKEGLMTLQVQKPLSLLFTISLTLLLFLLLLLTVTRKQTPTHSILHAK